MLLSFNPELKLHFSYMLCQELFHPTVNLRRKWVAATVFWHFRQEMKANHLHLQRM
jgi:hypothetical protein